MATSDIRMGDAVSNAPVIETGHENNAGAAQQPAQTGTENAEQTQPAQVDANAVAEQTQPAPKSKRELAMEQIYARRETARENEINFGRDALRESAGDESLVTGNDDAAAQTPPAAPTQSTQEQRSQPREQAAAQASHTPAQAAAHNQPQPSNALVRVNINGSIVELPQSELDALVADGARARMFAQSQTQQPARQVPQAPVQQQPAPQPVQQQPKFDNILNEDEASRLYNRILTGSEADGAQALRELSGNIAREMYRQAETNRQPVPHVDEAAIRQRITNDIRAEQQQQRNLETIGNEYPEIFDNQDTAQFAGTMVRNLTNQYRSMGVTKDNLTLYREACDRVRAMLGNRQEAAPVVSETQQTAPQVQSSPNPPAVSTRRVVDKRTLPTVPSGAGVRSGAQQSARPVSGTDIVNNMRAARGQNTFR